MISNEHYGLCRSILDDATLEEEDKIERLEELLRNETSLRGTTLDNAILDALWRHRNSAKGEEAETPLRHTVIRKSSPAPWQINRTPTPLASPPASSSPALSSGFPVSRPSFSRQKSTASPFVSPRPSPRLSLAHPIPHSPSLNGYEFSDPSPAPDIYGDYGSDNVDWLVGDETASNASSTGTGTLSAAAPEWVPQPEMGPYDILRSVLGDKMSDEQIEAALESNSYDMAATISTLLEGDLHETSSQGTSVNQETGVLVVSDSSSTTAQSFQLQDTADQFPALSGPNTPKSSNLLYNPSANGYFPTNMGQQRARGALTTFSPGSRPQSRPSSRHQNRPETPSSLSMDDPEAFPTLGSLSGKRGSKHHGHRSRHGGHGSTEKEVPASLADVVKMSPSPAPAQLKKTAEPNRKVRTFGAGDSTAARKIPEPQHIPWLETGSRANQQYLKHRAEAIKHGSIRNKFLQSAAQAWNRNDARAAKALSLRGQAENDAMRKAHREAAKALYEERNPHLTHTDADENELYIDLHGLHPEEAIEYLETILHSHSKTARRIIYAITGTGHHSKNGKDKVGKGMRNWLNEWGYVFREFSVPGERGGYIGGVLGIDVSSGGAGMGSARVAGEGDGDGASPPPSSTLSTAGRAIAGGGKIQVLKREEIIAQ